MRGYEWAGNRTHATPAPAIVCTKHHDTLLTRRQDCTAARRPTTTARAHAIVVVKAIPPPTVIPHPKRKAHLPAGVVEGSRLQVVHRVHRRVPRHQHPYDIEVALLAGPVQRRVVVSVPLVHITVVVDVLQQRI